MRMITKENVRMCCPFTITFWATNDPPCCAVSLLVEYSGVRQRGLQLFTNTASTQLFRYHSFLYGQYLEYYSYTSNSL